jgi:hypothetical protein
LPWQALHEIELMDETFGAYLDDIVELEGSATAPSKVGAIAAVTLAMVRAFTVSSVKNARCISISPGKLQLVWQRLVQWQAVGTDRHWTAQDLLLVRHRSESAELSDVS